MVSEIFDSNEISQKDTKDAIPVHGIGIAAPPLWFGVTYGDEDAP